MKFAPYTSGKLRKLKVGLSSDPAHDTTTSLEVLGGANIVGIVSATSIFISTTTATSDFANLNVSGVSTFAGNIIASGDINANGNILGDSATNISGISSVTATSLFGNLTGNVTGNADTATIATYTSEWIITSNGSSDYKFTGPGFDGTELDPTIYLKRGQQYKFTNNMGAHPFQIRTAINGSAYNDGVVNNGVSNGTLTWDVQMDAPNVLYYQCTSHAGMVGKIYIGNSGDSINIGTGVATFGGGINVQAGVSTFAGLANFNGNLEVAGNVTLGDGTGDNIDVQGRFVRELVPSSNGDKDLGTSSFRWGTLHIKNILQNGNGISTFSNDINANGNIIGDNATNISGINSVTATKFFGDGSGLSNTGAALAEASGTERLVLTNLTSGTMVSAATTSDVTFNANTDTFHIGTGVTIFGGTTGIVSAISYNGDLIIGTPTGGFKTGAFTITSTDKTKDSINELNNILGKLVPSPPDTINGQSISLTGTAGVGRLCAGFTPTNNTGGSAPVAGTQYTRNTDSTVSTNFLTEFGPGDSGTVTGFVNAVGVGTTTLSTGNNNGTYGSIQIANNEDASNSTRNTGIASGFYEIYDLRMVNGASPDGFNLAKFTQGSSTTGSVFWYEDPSTVSAPVISFGSVNLPASPTLSYSSGIPHYTESTNNNFTYVMTVTNASGDMYTQNTFVNSDGQTGAFQNPGNKSYTNFASGTNPPARNYGVGTGVTTLITQTPRNIHATVTSNIFTSFDASTPYGSHNNQRVGFTTDFNIMGTTADFTNNVDEDAIECTVGSLTGGSATRVPAISGVDNPSQSGASYSWGGGSAGSIATYEATVRGGDLRHDQTDYSTGYLPVGPNYSASRSGSQYFQFQFIQSSISEFQISYTGSLAGCWVCMPDNSTWTTSLSGVNGWADMFQAYKGSGVPTTAEPGCSSGGVMDTNGGTFTCVFGTESSSNDSNNRVLIRFKLTSGNSISDISLSDT